MTRALNAGDRMERLLSIVPWIAAHPDGALLSEVAERFDYPRERLLNDLNNVVLMVGLYPFTPDQLIDLYTDDETVWVHYAKFFTRPLRLTPHEALQLVAAGHSLLAVPGAEAAGPLARGLAKLSAVLGVEPGADVEVRLGAVDPATLELARRAAAENRSVRLEYYAHGRDEMTERVVDPLRVFSDQGHWYLTGYCHLAEGERVFRLDRIRSIVLTGENFAPPGELPAVSVYEPRPGDPRVTLLLEPEAAWVVETYPAERVEVLPGGRQRIVLAVSSLPWLERLLLRLGDRVQVEQVTGAIPPDLASRAAARLLARYRRSPE